MRPSDLPELRARQIDGMRVHVPRALGEDEMNNPISMSPAEEAERASTSGQSLRGWELGDLFYVTADMTQLAVAAARSMPDFELRREDLPSDFGLIYFDVPLNDDPKVPVSICAWEQSTDYATGAGVELRFYAFRDHPHPYPQWWLEDIMSAAYGGELLVIGDTEDTSRFWGYVIRCCWLLMQQRIATITDHRPDRASTRRLVRQGREPQRVRVISLRHPEAHGVPAEGGRTYHHRWVVRGHWRRQWYSSQERHMPIWISPFIKGAEGAPLLGGEKVYVWQR